MSCLIEVKARESTEKGREEEGWRRTATGIGRGWRGGERGERLRQAGRQNSQKQFKSSVYSIMLGSSTGISITDADAHNCPCQVSLAYGQNGRGRRGGRGAALDEGVET